MLRRARYCYSKVVRLSVCLSVTLRYCDHIGWHTSKIISWLISLGFLQSADPNITSAPKGHPKILARMGVGMEKVAFGKQKL